MFFDFYSKECLKERHIHIFKNKAEGLFLFVISLILLRVMRDAPRQGFSSIKRDNEVISHRNTITNLARSRGKSDCFVVREI